MSIALMATAWKLDLSATDKLVLLALADNANDQGSCWPSMVQIATKCGLTDRAVRAVIGRLASAGHLTRRERPGKGVVYTVHPGTSFPPEGNSPRNDVPLTPEPRSSKPSKNHQSSSKTSSSQKVRARKPPAKELFELPDWVPADAWAGWIEMRRANGKRPTRRALDLSVEKLKELADAGHPPGAVLDQSTRELWIGLFPLREQSSREGGETGQLQSLIDQAQRYQNNDQRSQSRRSSSSVDDPRRNAWGREEPIFAARRALGLDG